MTLDEHFKEHMEGIDGWRIYLNNKFDMILMKEEVEWNEKYVMEAFKRMYKKYDSEVMNELYHIYGRVKQ